MKKAQSFNLLSTVELGEKVALPALNSDNQALQNEVESQQRKQHKNMDKLNDVSSRVQIMCDYCQDIQRDISRMKNVLSAQWNQVETESHLSQLGTNEHGTVQKNIKQQDLKLEEINERNRLLQKTLEMKREELEQTRGKKTFDHSSFEDHLSRILETDELNVAVQKYMIQDEHAISELESRLKKQTDDLAKKRRLLDSAQTESRSIQVELDRCQKELNQSQMERKELLGRCQHSFELIEKRDSGVAEMKEALAALKKGSAKKQERILGKGSADSLEETRDTELHRRLERSDTQLARTRMDIRAVDLKRQQLEDDGVLLKSDEANGRAQQRSLQKQKQSLQRTLTEKEDLLTQAKEKREKAVQKIETGSKKSDTESQKQSVEEKMKAEESRVRNLQKEMKNLNDKFIKTVQTNQTAKKEEKSVNEANLLLRKTKRNLNSKLNQLETQKQKQSDALEFQNSKLDQLTRSKAEESSDAGSAKISERSDVPSQVSQQLARFRRRPIDNEEIRKTWETSIKQMEHELEKSRQACVEQTKEKVRIKDKKDQLEVEVGQIEKALRKLNNEKEDVLVQTNLQKVDLQMLAKSVTTKEEEILDLGKQKEDAILDLKTHKEERKAKKDLLQYELAQLEEERKKVAMKVKQNQMKTEKLKNRYDSWSVHSVGSDSSKKSSGSKGSNISKRDSEELENMQSELKMKIENVESTITGLSNTLRLVSSRNRTLRAEVSAVDPNSEESQECASLDRHCDNLQKEYQATRTVISQMKLELEKKKQELAIADSKGSEGIGNKSENIDQLIGSLGEEERKLEQWAKQNKKIGSQLRQSLGVKAKQTSNVERDINLKELKILNEAAEKHLAKILQTHASLRETAKDIENKSSLRLPSVSSGSSGQSLMEDKGRKPPIGRDMNGHVYKSAPKKSVKDKKKNQDSNRLPQLSV